MRFVDIWSRVRSVFPEPMGADPLSITPMRNTKEKKKFDLKTASGSWSFFNVPFAYCEVKGISDGLALFAKVILQRLKMHLHVMM